jgi:hypothetical protein
MMNYLVAVLSNRMQAEAAYSALEKEGLPSGQVDILGSGYKSADDYGLIDPSSIDIIPSLPPIGNCILGGLFGAAAGVMGAYFTGGTVGLALGSGDALPYRNRLNAGKYLIIVKGTDQLTRQATRVLRQFEPENIQGYIEPMSA